MVRRRTGSQPCHAARNTHLALLRPTANEESYVFLYLFLYPNLNLIPILKRRLFSVITALQTHRVKAINIIITKCDFYALK